LHVFTQVTSTLLHDGLSRTFVYYLPSNWAVGDNVPLMILLHGLTQTGAGVMDITQFNQIAEQEKFIIVYPDGNNFAWNANMNVSISSADDLGFIENLAGYFQNNFGTDPQRQYLVGFSNGGFMSHKIACESSMCFAAIATVSGNMSDTTFNNCSPVYNTSVLHLHGTSDAIVPYNGGTATGVSVTQTMEKWQSFLTCDPIPVSSAMPNPNLIDLSSPTLLTYQNCTSDLKHIRIDGGAHQWPGIQTVLGGAGIINFDFYSPDYIWSFLNGKSCPSNMLSEEELLLKVLPNPAQNFLIIESDRILAVELFDLTGKRLLKGNSSEQISLSDLYSGIYLLNLSDGCKTKNIKIVKE